MKKRHRSTLPAILIMFAVLINIAPVATEAATNYVDGEYTISFEVLKDSTNDISATSDYMVSPAKLKIENGRMHLTVTLNNSTWWQYFQIQAEQSGSFKEVTFLSEDVEANTRTVGFEIFDIEQLLPAKIHIVVTGIPGFVYDNKYDIRFKFDHSELPVVQDIAETELNPDSELATTPEAVENTDEVPEMPLPETITETEMAAGEETESGAPSEFEENENSITPNESVDNTVEDIPDPTPGQTIEDSTSENNTEPMPSESNKTLLISILAIGILVIVFIIYRTRKKKS